MQFRLLFLSGIILLAGCTNVIDNGNATSIDSSSDIPEWYWAEYYMTECNGVPWVGETDEEMIQYYQGQYDIAIQDVVSIDSDDFVATCEACGCTTGEVVRVQVSLEDRKKLLDLGFSVEGDYKNPATEKNSDDQDDEIDNNNEDVVIEETGDIVEEYSPEELVAIEDDIILEDIAANVQLALKKYYETNHSYPDTLEELEMIVYDLERFTYTPIGTTPAKYYDLVVAYSTGRVTLNP